MNKINFDELAKKYFRLKFIKYPQEKILKDKPIHPVIVSITRIKIRFSNVFIENDIQQFALKGLFFSETIKMDSIKIVLRNKEK